MWNLKYGTNELIYKTESIHRQKTNLWLPKGKRGKGINYEFGISKYKLPYIGVLVVAQWLTNPTRNNEVADSIPGLAQWVGDPVLP